MVSLASLYQPTGLPVTQMSAHMLPGNAGPLGDFAVKRPRQVEDEAALEAPSTSRPRPTSAPGYHGAGLKVRVLGVVGYRRRIVCSVDLVQVIPRCVRSSRQTGPG